MNAEEDWAGEVLQTAAGFLFFNSTIMLLKKDPF